MNLSQYKARLSSHGKNVSQVAKAQSDMILNETFCSDPNYKRVYILTPNGWVFEDAKYQFHTAQSILRDKVDYYLQFRPKVHYPIGTYVIVPDDTDTDINLSLEELKNPFCQPINKRTQWWLIVDRDEANAYVRYNILKCNWDFKWISNGKIESIFGIARSAKSYTSGVWRDEYTASLDDLTSAWLPDTHYVYGDKLSDLGLSDSRTLKYEQRFLLTTNIYDPKVFQTTKIVELSPLGIVKLSLKQDEFNEMRDNLELMICDYYTDSGEARKDEPVLIEPNDPIRDVSTSNIVSMVIDELGEYMVANSTSHLLKIGSTSYYRVNFSTPNVDPEWRVQIHNPNNQYSEHQISYWQGLIKLTKLPNNLLSLKIGKAGSLAGISFDLSVSDSKGDYYSSLSLEVSE